MVPSWLLDEMAQQLESKAERRQIHQLAFAVNQHRWPEDANLLDLYRLRDLVQDLTRSYRSFEELKQALRRALSQAPESKSFIPAARTLLKAARQAYQGDRSAAALPSEESLGGFQPSDPAAQRLSPFETRTSNASSHPFPPLPYDEIASTLGQSPSATRIKKLLYAVCSGEWSNDPIMLGRFRLTNLLKQLHKMSSDEAALHSALRNVVVTLNRQMEYELVAQLIQRECQRLYSSLEVSSLEVSSPEDSPLEEISTSYYRENSLKSAISQSSAVEESNFTTGPERRSSGLPNNSSSLPDSGVDPVPLGFYDDDDDAPEPTGVLIAKGNAGPAHALSSANAMPPEHLAESLSQNPPYGYPSTQQSTSRSASEPWAAPNYNPGYAHSPQANPAPTDQEVRPLDWLGLAELRVELMRYANPLRVKALMFSTLYYPFDLDSGGDWSKLQTETLGDLILRLMEQFTSHSSLDEQLQLMARQLRPSDEYGNAAGAIARALRPFYPAMNG